MYVAYEAVWGLGVMLAWSTEYSCFDSHRSDKRFFFLLQNHKAHPPIKLVKFPFFSGEGGVKRPERDPHHSPLGSAEFKNEWATHLLCTCAFMERTGTIIHLPLPNSVTCCAPISR